MNDWIATLRGRLEREPALVRVLVASVRGSAPREAGTSMLVGGPVGLDTTGQVDGTIGGGHLEWQAIAIARDMLATHSPASTRVDPFSLGATLGQCCGGAVELWFERYDQADRGFIENAFAASREAGAMITTVIWPGSLAKAQRTLSAVTSSDDGANCALLPASAGQRMLRERVDPVHGATELWVHGAGHVGSALIAALAGLPLRIIWVDAREEQFHTTIKAALPVNVRTLCSDDPAGEIAHAPAGALHVVLTHSHDLDFAICRALLERGDFAWAGLIGSKTKATRFVQRLAQRGFAPAQIRRIVCPIGIAGITGKHPAAIAISVAAQLLQVIEANAMLRQLVSATAA